jgi:oxygen-dependent protoporphyrinogen oxidase
MRETKPHRPPRIAIIGGGISGLAAAHALVERSAELNNAPQILLLEASPRLGGVISTSRRDGFLLEGGPDSFISEKPEALQLADRIGLREHLIETTETHRRSFICSRLRACGLSSRPGSSVGRARRVWLWT